MTVPEAAWIDYDYAVVRVVPQVHVCTFLNVGVVLHARTARYLATRLEPDVERLHLLCHALDVDLLYRYLDAYERVCRGGPSGGAIGLLPPSERFHWLTAPRSSVLQTSRVHPGRTHDPERTLHDLFAMHVQGA